MVSTEPQVKTPDAKKAPPVELNKLPVQIGGVVVDEAYRGACQREAEGLANEAMQAAFDSFIAEAGMARALEIAQRLEQVFSEIIACRKLAAGYKQAAESALRELKSPAEIARWQDDSLAEKRKEGTLLLQLPILQKMLEDAKAAARSTLRKKLEAAGRAFLTEHGNKAAEALPPALRRQVLEALAEQARHQEITKAITRSLISTFLEGLVLPDTRPPWEEKPKRPSDLLPPIR